MIVNHCGRAPTRTGRAAGPRGLRRTGAGLLALALAVAAGASATQARPAKWAPYPVDVWTTPFDMDSARSDHDYVPTEAASQPWQLCVTLPHMKDSYWRAVNFGLVEEIRRLGLKAEIKAAGGYTELETQKAQIADCIDSGVDALIVGAISAEGLNELAARAAAKDIPVVDLVNGMSAPDLAAKSLVSFGEMGEKAGRFILQEAGARGARVAWFPGPEGAAWVAAGDAGFKSALKGSKIEVAVTAHGDTTPEAQKALVEEVLDSGEKIDIIAGTAVTADVAVDALETRGLADEVQVVSYYLTPAIYRHIRRGRVAAAPTDSPVIQARIAVDQAVRILEKAEVKRHVGPKIIVLDRTTINFFDYLSALPPRKFEPVMRVE